MPTQQKTCGPLYLEALEKYTGGDEKLVRCFAAGFVSGEGEKVYLGASPAAMFRPSERQYGSMIREVLNDVAARYELTWTRILGEYWIYRGQYAQQIDELRFLEIDSPEWHRLRAKLCGVPEVEVDEHFHMRKGYGESCDIVKKG